jgi:hypothetical protein
VVITKPHRATQASVTQAKSNDRIKEPHRGLIPRCGFFCTD